MRKTEAKDRFSLVFKKKKIEQNKRKSESHRVLRESFCGRDGERAAVAIHYQDDESNILPLIVVVWATCGPHRWQSA